MFLRKHAAPAKVSSGGEDFGYLDREICYLDSACQTLRPQCVLDAELEYYRDFNACGGRVKYKWGAKVDEKVQAARKSILELSGKTAREYCVAFTLNTTYGINLVLHQLPAKTFERMVTSEIEHNSVMLPSMTFAKRQGVERMVLPREADGSLRYEKSDLKNAIVLLNAQSNIDGRIAGNLPKLAEDTHAEGGIVLVDGAQAFAHSSALLRETDFDAAFGSGHKMYGPSIGFIVIKRSLLDRLDPFFIGGGTVTDVAATDFTLLREGDEAHAVLEAGLQNWAGIIGLGRAVEWLKTESQHEEETLSRTLFQGLQALPRVQLLNTAPSPIVSFSVEGIDSHALALYLDEQHILCRSGYFCCHAYLLHQLKAPAQLRVSLGRQTTPEHIDHFLHTLSHILTTL